MARSWISGRYGVASATLPAFTCFKAASVAVDAVVIFGPGTHCRSFWISAWS
ncbi:hypothetical protein D3C71_1876970 [compost metagenome]